MICRVIQVQLGAIDRSQIAFERRTSALYPCFGRSDSFPEYVRRGTNLVMLCFGYHTGPCEFGVSRRLRIGVLPLGAFTSERRLGLAQLGTISGNGRLCLTQGFSKWPCVDFE